MKIESNISIKADRRRSETMSSLARQTDLEHFTRTAVAHDMGNLIRSIRTLLIRPFAPGVGLRCCTRNASRQNVSDAYRAHKTCRNIQTQPYCLQARQWWWALYTIRINNMYTVPVDCARRECCVDLCPEHDKSEDVTINFNSDTCAQLSLFVLSLSHSLYLAAEDVYLECVYTKLHTLPFHASRADGNQRRACNA